jgi:hypothetical protein
MKMIWIMIVAAALIIAGCGGKGVLSVDETGGGTLSGEEVKQVSEAPHDADAATVAMVHHIGGQILESAYRRYREAGYTEIDFGRMPDTPFRGHCEELCADLKAAVE